MLQRIPHDALLSADKGRHDLVTAKYVVKKIRKEKKIHRQAHKNNVGAKLEFLEMP